MAAPTQPFYNGAYYNQKYNSGRMIFSNAAWQYLFAAAIALQPTNFI